MIQAFYTGISGIKSNQTSIDLITDNLANTSTIGFREYDSEFSSMFEESLNMSSGMYDSIGVGVKFNATTMSTATGNIILSDRSTDIAIMNNGWFGIQNGDDNLYTRAGNFTFDRDSDLVTSDGHFVLGTMGNNISEDGILTSIVPEVPLGDIDTQEKLRFPKNITYLPEPSTTATYIGNIGSDANVMTMGAGVVDSQNNKNNLKIDFTKSVPQALPGVQWDVVATTQNLEGTTVYDTKTGVVSFDDRGALISSTLSTIDNNGTEVTIDLGTGFEGVVSIDTMPLSLSSSSNGTMGGDLSGYSIDKNGEIIATFSNGLQSSVGRVAIFHFGNEQGLERASGARFAQTSNSGDAFFYKDENGQNIIGTDLQNFYLEGSNVSMTTGLTDLIVHQRAFTANSKLITTSDEMMQKALAMDA